MNALGGFTGAVLLAVFAVMMGWESVERLLSPVGIAFNQAVGVAVVGLVVNGVCVAILGHQHADHDDHQHTGHAHKHDHNLRAAQSPEHYKGLLPRELHLVHQTVEVHRCRDRHAAARR